MTPQFNPADLREFNRIYPLIGKNVQDKQTGSVVRLTGITVLEHDGGLVTSAIVDHLHSVQQSLAIDSTRVEKYDDYPQPSGY